MQLIELLIFSNMYPITHHQLPKSQVDEASVSVKLSLGLLNKNIEPLPVRTPTTPTTKQAEPTTKVIAITNIPRGTCSEDINVAHLTQEEISPPQNVSTCYT
jgi:hypothetical protein